MYLRVQFFQYPEKKFVIYEVSVLNPRFPEGQTRKIGDFL